MLGTLEANFRFSARPCNILSSLRSQKFQQLYCFQNGILCRNLLDCEVLLCEIPLFGETCSITIPMNIISETIPCLECSRERILIAMTLRRKTLVAVIITTNLNKLSSIRCQTGDVGVISHLINNNYIRQSVVYLTGWHSTTYVEGSCQLRPVFAIQLRHALPDIGCFKTWPRVCSRFFCIPYVFLFRLSPVSQFSRCSRFLSPALDNIFHYRDHRLS